MSTIPPDQVNDGDDRFRRIAYRMLWVVSLIACPAAMWVVWIISTGGPRTEDRSGTRVPVVPLEYIFGVHLLLSCFAAWASFTVWRQWWFVGWGVVLLAGVGTFGIGVVVVLGIFYW